MTYFALKEIARWLVVSTDNERARTLCYCNGDGDSSTAEADARYIADTLNQYLKSLEGRAQ